MARIAQIVSTARYLPDRVVPNAELAERFAALGRPVMEAADPRAAADAIQAEIAQALG